MKTTQNNKENYLFQKRIAIVGIFLFIIKLIAWYLTNSVAILTDTLESTINIIAGLFGLYSLYLSSLPKDRNHPYGHGKIEFISASVEGVLITLAGFYIIYEAVDNIKHPKILSKIDYGIILVFITAVINYIFGYYAIKKGKKNNSIALISSGKHLQTDTYSTIGIVIGLIVLYFTNITWLDSVIALIFAGFIIYTGYGIIREAISGIMDETDENLLQNVVQILNEKRRENWIDLHNLRIIKYGSTLHFDCHMTVPYYFNINEGHEEVEHLENIIKQHFGNRVEFFVHLDACKPFSCKICSIANCPFRSENFVEKISWNKDNIIKNQKHIFDQLG